MRKLSAGLTGLVLLAVVVIFIAPVQASAPTAKLKSQLAAQRAKVSSLQKQLAKSKVKIATQKTSITALTSQVTTLQGQLPPLDAQITNLTAANGTLTCQVNALTAQIGTLTTQVSQQAAGGTAAIVAASPADQWSAILAIWNVFPKFTTGQFCGFDKSNDLFGGTGLNIADYTFTDDTNC
jgi:septal ring factor EnvC (AmiA/AmiB activator)